MRQHGTIVRGTYDSPISSLSKYPCPEWNRIDINGLCDVVRPSLARFLPILARRPAVEPPLLYVPSFIDDAEEKGGEKVEGVRRRFLGEGTSSRSMSFANASRNKIFETRARILALAYIRRSFPFRYGPAFAYPILSSRSF